MHNLHANEEEGVTSVPGTNGQPLDLSLYDKLNKAKIKVKRGRLRRLHKSRSQIYPHKYNLCMKNNQQNSNRAPCLAVKSEILICPICHMEATNFSIFAQHMSLHFSQLPMNSSDYFNYNYDSYKYLQENVGTRCNVDMETRNSTVDNEHLTPENTRLLELIMLKDYCSAEDIVTKGDEENCGVKTSTSNVNILSCNICSNLTTFGQFADLMNHLQNKHLLTYYYCNGCGEKFTDRIQCLVHILCRHVSPTKPVDGGSDNTFHASDSSTTVTNNTDVNSAVLSSNANENNSLKCHSVNGIWNTEPRLHNIRSMNTVIKEKNSVQNLNKFIKNKISSSLNEYSSNHHSTTNEQCDLSNLNKQVDNGLNRERFNHQDNNENIMDKPNINCVCQTQSLIHFLSMVLWPSLWSVNLMQSNIEEPLNRQPEIPEQTTNQCTESMISNSEKCTPFLVSSPLSTSSSPTTSNFQKKFEIQEGPNQKSSCSEPDKFENGKCSSSNKPTELLQDIHESVPSCVFLLRSHPVLGLLPHEIASRVDSYKASKMCHICLKEFTDEMTVLHHQVEAHSLEDV